MSGRRRTTRQSGPGARLRACRGANVPTISCSDSGRALRRSGGGAAPNNRRTRYRRIATDLERQVTGRGSGRRRNSSGRGGGGNGRRTPPGGTNGNTVAQSVASGRERRTNVRRPERYR